MAMQRAVVVAPSVSAREGPGEKSASHFEIHEGTTVRVSLQYHPPGGEFTHIIDALIDGAGLFLRQLRKIGELAQQRVIHVEAVPRVKECR